MQEELWEQVQDRSASTASTSSAAPGVHPAAQIRGHARAMGLLDLLHLSDEELVRGVSVVVQEASQTRRVQEAVQKHRPTCPQH